MCVKIINLIFFSKEMESKMYINIYFYVRRYWKKIIQLVLNKKNQNPTYYFTTKSWKKI